MTTRIFVRPIVAATMGLVTGASDAGNEAATNCELSIAIDKERRGPIFRSRTVMRGRQCPAATFHRRVS
jgi:hypothetical protein